MGYFIVIVISFIILTLSIYYSKKKKRKNKIDKLRLIWGKVKTGYFDFSRIGNFSSAVKESRFHRLTEQTIEDIDFYELFKFIDRTTSKVGQQFLFKKLIEPTANYKDPSQDLVQWLTSERYVREAIQLELLKLNSNDAYHIPALLQNPLLERPKWLKFLVVDVIIVVSLLILSFKFPLVIIVLIIPFTLNMFLHYWNKNNAFEFVRSFSQLDVLIEVSKSLSKKGELLYNESVQESILELRSFQRQASLININSGNGIQAEISYLTTYLFEILKAFFLVEVFSLFRLTKELETRRSAIISLFDYVGNIDVSISIASLRSGSLRTCLPILVSDRKGIIIKNIYHPLIPDCVANDLSIDGKSILITGSNMSGKSTFLRTLILNSILAQTIYTCFAEEFISPILKQHSSIRIDDNVFKGRSYYFQEVKVISSLLEEVELPHQNLFVLDEVFKGTNTLERISAAKAILSYLNKKNNIVIVSTHDLELAKLLVSEYDIYHFIETVRNTELHFDHIIKPGQLITGNAIRLLEILKYPDDIIKEARQISMSLNMPK